MDSKSRRFQAHLVTVNGMSGVKIGSKRSVESFKTVAELTDTLMTRQSLGLCRS